MNLTWLATLLQLIEGYATDRATPGVTTAEANLATLASATALVQHIATAAPAVVATPASAPTPVVPQ